MAGSPSVGTRKPLLTFTFIGRNDAYMGDFTWRLETTLNFLARSAAAIDRLDDIDVLVVDWNSEVPLHRICSLVPEAQRITSFLPVPKSIAERVQQDTEFPHSIVLNAALRRTRGEYISIGGSDLLFTSSTLWALLAVLEGKYPHLPIRKALMTGARRHVPNAVIGRRLPLVELERYVDRNASFFPTESGGSGHAAPTNIMLMHRDLWHECRGADERMIYWGFADIDLALRVTGRHPFIHLDSFGVNVLHMEHWSQPRDYTPGKVLAKLNPVDGLMPSFTVNDADWGLGSDELPVCRSETPAIGLALPAQGGTEQWNVSLEQVGSGIVKPEFLEFTEKILGQFRGLPVGGTEVPALTCLAWCAATRKPRSYVELGFRYPHAAVIVIGNSPGVELFAIVDWEQKNVDKHLYKSEEGQSLIFHVCNSLRQSGHWAYTRYVNGDQPNPVLNLKTDPTSILPIDLAMIRATKDSYIAQAPDVVSMLRPGGAAVVTAPNKDAYQRTTTRVLEKFPTHSVIHFGDGLNGMILAARCADGAQRTNT